MKSQKRKVPDKKEAKHKAPQAKETTQESQPIDPVLMGKYHEETAPAWQATKVAYPLRFDSPQAWNEWKAAVTHQYNVWKKYKPLFFPQKLRSEEEAKYSCDFYRDIELLRGGDATQKEVAIAFLEADPWFPGSGYDKVRLVRYIKPQMLSSSDVSRLQNVVLSMVEQRNGTDFSAFWRLAKKVDDPYLREQLTRQMNSDNADVRRRARWVLEALAQKDSLKKT